MSTLTAGPESVLEDGEHNAITPFWQRLNSFFLFPLQLEPLILALLLALGSYLLLMPPPAFFLILAGLLLGMSRYAFKVAALASRGVLHSRDYRSAYNDPDWKVLPWKFFAILLVHVGLFIALSRVNPWLGLLAQMGTSLLVPATLMVLIQSASLRAALNPFELLGTIADIGAQYLVLWLFLFLLLVGMDQVVGLLAPVAPDWLLLPAIVFTGTYFMWVMAALVGYVMYQHHGTLDIQLLQEPDHQPESAPKTQAQLRDEELSALVQKGQLSEAIAQAREWVRVEPDSLPDQRRYHRVLLLDEPQSGRLREHSPRFIAQLLAHKQGPEALQAHSAVLARLPDFALSEADTTLQLAEQAWKRMDAKQTLALLRGFDRRFAGSSQIPSAYELIIRALKQGMARGDKALPVYQALRKRYPEHPATQEAAWVLREELQSPA